VRFRNTRFTKYWCAYHFAWIPEHRRDVIVGDIAEYTRAVLREILRELECEPLALDVSPDHIHVFALCPPRHSPAYIANYLKGKSARRILQKFPGLKTGATRGKLWSRSYLVATDGDVMADVIGKYVEEQWARENEKGQHS
jgi:putative transposase